MRRVSLTILVVVLVILITPLIMSSPIIETSEIEEAHRNPVDSHQPASRVEIYGESGWIDGNFSGSGTQEDPYVIENLTLESSSDCLSIYYTESHFVVRNCSFTVTADGYGGASGVYLNNVANGRIENCEIRSVYKGIYLFWSRDCTIEDNVVMAEGGPDVELYYSMTCAVKNNEFHGQGIYIDWIHWSDPSSWDFNLEGNTLAGVPIGSFTGLEDTILNGNQYAQIFLRDSRNVTIVGGNFGRVSMAFSLIECIDCSIVSVSTNVTRRELTMLECHNFTLDGGTFASDRSDILTRLCSNISFTNIDGGNTSIDMRESPGSQICESVLRDIDVYYSNDCIIEGVSARTLYIYSVVDVLLRQSRLESARLRYLQFCLIFNNTILSNYDQRSIYSYYCSNLSITDNRINGRVDIRRSSNVTFSDNYIVSEYRVEVGFSRACNNVTVHNNQLVNSSFKIARYDQEWTFDFSNNTVNFKPVLYIQDQENVTISGDSYSQLFVIDSQNIEVTDSSFSDAYTGAFIHGSEGCSLDNVTFQNCNEYQLLIQEVSHISVANSDFLGDSNYAILIEDTSGCNISYSTIEECVSVEFSTSISFRDCNMSFQDSVYSTGLEFKYVNSSQIESCNITDAGTLVTIERSRDIQIHNNKLNAGVALSTRFQISESVNLTLSGNDFGNSRFDLEGNLPEHWYHDFTNNWKDGKPLVCRRNISDKHISLDLYGHLILVSCRDILISSGGDLETTGLQIAYSENIQIMGLNMELLPECPIRVFSSYDVSFQDCRLLNEGIEFVQSQNLNMIRCQILVADYLSFSDCSNVYIEGCTIDSARMYFWSGSCVSMENSIFQSDSLVQVWRVSDIKISTCHFGNGYRGVLLRYCTNVRLIDLSISEMSGEAIEIRNSDTINVHRCRIYNSRNGIDLAYNSGGFFTSNWIFNSGATGISVHDCDDFHFWNNALAGNGDNAWERSNVNCTWDNGEGWGNYWNDATEGIPYVISENSNAVDRYPRVLPNPDFENPDINNPSDITVWLILVEDTTIEWRAMDENPLDYWIEIDGIFYESGEFQDRSFEFSLPSLSVGDHTITIVVIDPLGRTASDVVIVQVTEVPLSYQLNIMLSSAYLGFLLVMVVGLSFFVIGEMMKNALPNITEKFRKFRHGTKSD